MIRTFRGLKNDYRPFLRAYQWSRDVDRASLRSCMIEVGIPAFIRKGYEPDPTKPLSSRYFMEDCLGELTVTRAPPSYLITAAVACRTLTNKQAPSYLEQFLATVTPRIESIFVPVSPTTNPAEDHEEQSALVWRDKSRCLIPRASTQVVPQQSMPPFPDLAELLIRNLSDCFIQQINYKTGRMRSYRQLLL